VPVSEIKSEGKRRGTRRTPKDIFSFAVSSGRKKLRKLRGKAKITPFLVRITAAGTTIGACREGRGKR